jgi:hypothetical protein
MIEKELVTSGSGRSSSGAKAPSLLEFGVDLTEQAASVMLDPDDWLIPMQPGSNTQPSIDNPVSSKSHCAT